MKSVKRHFTVTLTKARLAAMIKHLQDYAEARNEADRVFSKGLKYMNGLLKPVVKK